MHKEIEKEAAAEVPISQRPISQRKKNTYAVKGIALWLQQTMNITNTLEESLECSICSVLFENPKQLHCGHTFCFACVRKMMSTTYGARAIICPHCRERTIVPPQGLPTNFLVGELVAKVNEVHLKTADAPTCFACQAILPKADVAVCRTCANVHLCSLCVLKYHKDHDTEFMDVFMARQRVANARAYICRQQKVCKKFVDHISYLSSRNHIAKEGRVEEAVRKIFAEFDVLLEKLGNNDDEKSGITLSPDELCVAIYHSNQISCTIDGIYTSGVQLVQSIRNFFKDVTTAEQSTINCVSRPSPTEIQHLMTVLDAEEQEVGDKTDPEPPVIDESGPSSSSGTALRELLPFLAGETNGDEISSSPPLRNTFAYQQVSRQLTPRRIRGRKLTSYRQ